MVTADKGTDEVTGRNRKHRPNPASPDAAQARRATRSARDRRITDGEAAREAAPLSSHASFSSDQSRDPVGLLLSQAGPRVPELMPIRHGRMLVSPLTFYRGAALPMSADLAKTPSSGLRVQLCGDAHLSNFGVFASPERRLVFDVNDFDETLPGPFEWDVKRLAASLAVAGRESGFSQKARRKIVLSGAEGYRTAMRQFATQPLLEVWYAHVEIEQALRDFQSRLRAKGVKKTQSLLSKARTRDSWQALAKLTKVVDGRRRIVSDPPLIVPVEEVFADVESDALYDQLRSVLASYAKTLQSDRQHLLNQFHLVQVARKVVGVGSVGTRAWILLMEAGGGVEPLFLQAKEAQPSVLVDYSGVSAYANQGQRVVAGQHLMQAQSDIFLGWTGVTGADGVERDFYVRQLRDWKFSLPIEQMRPPGMRVYAQLCGWTLARAHARSGDRVALAAYLGDSEEFDQALADFAETYADQNERDYEALRQAAADGRVESTAGV